MTTLMFLCDVIALVLLAFWAARNDRAEGGDGVTGLFGMRVGQSRPRDEAKSAPRWRRAGSGVVGSGRLARSATNPTPQRRPA